MLMDAARSFLLVIDMQEKLLLVMDGGGGDAVVHNAGVLLQAATQLSVPTLIFEQYPKGIGSTVAPILAVAPKGAAMAKLTFSCMGEEPCAARIKETGIDQNRKQVVVVGMEAHVCVLQTVMELLGEGYQVFVVSDATSSRSAINARLALDRMAQAGAHVVSTEMVVFEWLRRAGTDVFKALSKLIK